MKILGLERIFKTPGNPEKPPFLFHGSLTGDIEELEPRERHKPEESIGARVYATPFPAWAAAHSWDWSSEDRVDTRIKNGKVVLIIPKHLKEKLFVPVYIYKVPSESFNKTGKEFTGNTYDSVQKIKPVSVEKFNSVIEAIQYFDGEISYI